MRREEETLGTPLVLYEGLISPFGTFNWTTIITSYPRMFPYLRSDSIDASAISLNNCAFLNARVSVHETAIPNRIPIIQPGFS